MPPAEPAEARPAPVAADPECSPDHAAMGHCTPKAMPDCPTGAVGTDLPAGAAPAPAAPGDWYADRLYPKAEMDRSRDRKRVVYGKSVSVLVDHGGRRIIKKTNEQLDHKHESVKNKRHQKHQ